MFPLFVTFKVNRVLFLNENVLIFLMTKLLSLVIIIDVRQNRNLMTLNQRDLKQKCWT